MLYEPAYFGVKPFLVLKGGLLVNAQMGDPNASIATPQPVYMRPQFAAYGRALSKSCLTFVSKAALKNGIAERYGLQREVVAVENCRKIGKKDMKPQRGDPRDPGRRRHVPGLGRRREGRQRAARDAADDPALFPVLRRGRSPLGTASSVTARPRPRRRTMNLCLLQIADSALPIGGYTHSWGLEAAIARGLVHDPESLERWTGQWLRTSLGPLEGVLVASSCRAAHAGNSA